MREHVTVERVVLVLLVGITLSVAGLALMEMLDAVTVAAQNETVRHVAG